MHLTALQQFDFVPACSVTDWDRIYALDRNALPSQSPAWAEAIRATSGYSVHHRHYSFADGTEALLPLFSRTISGNPLGLNWSPPAAWGFGGPLSTRPLHAGQLAAILEDCTHLPGAAIQIRPNPILAETWRQAAESTDWTRLERQAHVLDLSGGFDEVWNNRFPKRTRNLVQKAERIGITVETGSSARLVADFYGLLRLSFVRWAKKQNEYAWLASLRGRLRDPERKFVGIARLCRDIMQVTIARRDGKAIAGIVVLYGHNAHYTRGAMDEQAVGNTGANSLLHATAIREACERSCHVYNMGESGASTSIAAFKAGFGAVATPYAEYRHERFPILTANEMLRGIVKRAIGFRDV